MLWRTDCPGRQLLHSSYTGTSLVSLVQWAHSWVAIESRGVECRAASTVQSRTLCEVLEAADLEEGWPEIVSLLM